MTLSDSTKSLILSKKEDYSIYLKRLFLYKVIIIILSFFFISKAFSFNNQSHFTLDNGLEVYLFQTNNPIVTQVITYDVGSMEEVSSKEGIAHYLEHVMFLGTHRYPKEKFSSIMKDTSATYNAFTSYDITAYYISLPSMYLEEAIAIESDRIRGLVFNEKAIENEKYVIKEEKNMNQNSGYNNFFEILRRYQHPISNYGKNIIGYDSSFFNISASDLKDFYHRWYQPQNAKLFIIGNIDLNKTTKLVKKYYGKIKQCRDCETQRANYLEESYNANSLVIYKSQNINKDLGVLSYLTPSYNSDNSDGKKKSYALYLLSRLLGSSSGKLYKELVLDKQLALDLWTSYDFSQKGDGTFSFGVLPQGNIDEAMKGLEISLSKIMKEGFREDDLQNEINKVRDELEYLQEDSESFIIYLASSINSGMSYNDIMDLDSNLRKVSLEDINKVFKELIESNSVEALATKG